MPDGDTMPSVMPSPSSIEQHHHHQSMIINNDNNHSFNNPNNVTNHSQNQQRLSRSLNVSNNVNNISNNTNSSNDPNNNMNMNQGMDPGGGGGGEVNDRRDIFEDIRNGHGGAHWRLLLRQVVLNSPNSNEDSRDSKDDDSPSSGLDPNNQSDGPLIPLQVSGGSENGQFVYLGLMDSDINAWIAVGYLQPGDIILDIETQQVAGYTQADVLSLLHHCLRGNPVTLTVAPRGSLGPDLRSYLNTRFQKNSVDHALQGVVRDNLYLRTVPVTTRLPRPGETPFFDYTFLTTEEFMELERNGSLLESGVYAGNHYGTPKPYASRPRTTDSSQIGGMGNSYSGGENSKSTMLPGLHPSSEGKRRRNRSNVEALGAGDDEPPSPNINSSTLPVPITYSTRIPSPDELGPLPANWEMSYTEKGEVYFIDHNTGTSHWLDPRLSRIQKLSLEDCADNELPFGWELIEDPHYGTYYIDHVNRRTQFENPVIIAKQLKPNLSDHESTSVSAHDGGEFGPPQQRPPSASMNSNSNSNSNSNTMNPPTTMPSKGNPPQAPPKPTNSLNLHRLSIPRGKTPVEFNSNPHMDSHNSHSHSSLLNHDQSSGMNSGGNNNNSGLRVKSVGRDRLRFFTRDPTQLVGERIHCTLLKSSRGLGFTIVGGDDDDGLDEFLQIKSVVTDGPAWRDGKLRTGDVLVRVNGRCVLGFTHQEMVSIFQSISPGEEVHLEVCRGYPLPFDPADPNTEIVTTVAVAPLSSTDSGDKRPIDWTGRTTPDSLAHSAHSLPELSTERIVYGKANTGRPASVDLLLDSPSLVISEKGFSKHLTMESGIFLTIELMKGTGGFGFTIADSVAGQKVKKVLDASHCGGLEEGDRLIAIDNIDLRGLSHTQVVQVLKDFPLGRKASLTIQRVRVQPAYTHKINSIGSSHYSDTRLMAPDSQPPGLMPRSKTPTADLGRTRPRLRDSLPERPKTPLLDSGSHLNGQPVHYNGELQHMGQNSHQYLSERFSSSSLGGTSNNDTTFPGNDLSQVCVIRDWVEMTIELQRRQEGFGFRIVGGTEEGSQVSVGHIVPRGSAALDGRLQTNDQIIAVDGIQVIGASHHSVVQLMARSAAGGRVRLSIRRPIYGPVTRPPDQTDFTASSTNSPLGLPSLHVTLRRQPSEGFGFVIISNASKAGATIGRIVEGSPADRCGHIHVGDRILAVNHIDISQLHHSQVVQLIKDSGLVLTLSVLASIVNSGQGPSHPQTSPSNRSNTTMTDLEDLTLKANHGYDIGTAFISPDHQPIQFGSNHSGASSFPESLDQVFSVQLGRGARGFGFSIRGGKEFQNMPLFVLRLAEDGPAAMDGRIQVGDQILQINGISTQGMTHSQAINIIKTGDASVHMLLRRGAVSYFPFLNQMPNFSTGGFGSSNGGQEEEQSLSSSNDPQFISQNSPMFREHRHSAYSSQT